MLHRRLSAVALALMLVACASAKLTPQGSTVAVLTPAPSAPSPGARGCRSLGPVVGTGAGPCGSGWVSKKDLVAIAMDDLRDRAADLGANYLAPGTPEFSVAGEFHGTRTSMVGVRGTAYRCDGTLPAELGPQMQRIP
jgi:hypothetical protein